MARFGSQWIEEDGFRFIMELIEVDPGAAETFGDSDFDPIGRTVTGAFETFWIHEGFGQSDGVTVALLPILTEAAEVQTRMQRVL